MKRFVYACVAIAFTTSFRGETAAQHKIAPNLSPDLAVVPAETNYLVAINLTRYWNGPETESLKKLADSHPVVPSWSLRDLPTYTGLQPENVVRMMQFTAATEAITTISTSQPYDREKVLRALAPEAVEKSAAGKTYFYSSKSTNAVYFLDDQTLVIGMGHDIAGFLSRPASTGRDPALDRVLLASHEGAPFVLHAGAAVVRSIATEKNMQQGPYAPFAQARDWQIIATIAKQLTVDLRADFNTKEEALNSAPAFKLVTQKLADLVPFYRAHMSPFLKEQEAQYPGARELAAELSATFDATDAALKAVQITSTEKSAVARIEIKSDKPATTAVLLLTLTPRAEKQASER